MLQADSEATVHYTLKFTSTQYSLLHLRGDKLLLSIGITFLQKHLDYVHTYGSVQVRWPEPWSVKSFKSLHCSVQE